MPKGLARIQQLGAEANERSRAFEAGESAGGRALKLNVGQSATGRFLEEGANVVFLYMHELPLKRGQEYGDRVQCLNQDDDPKVACPGCDVEGVKRMVRVVMNFIRYDEPKLVRDAQKKAIKDHTGNYVFDGTEPALTVWELSQTVGGRIAYLEQENNGGDPNHGIANHVVKIYRAGTKDWNVDVVARDVAPDSPDVLAMAGVDKPFERALHDKKVDPAKAIQNVFPRYLSRPVMSVAEMTKIYTGSAAASAFVGGDPSNVYTQAAQAQTLPKVDSGAFS